MITNFFHKLFNPHCPHCREIELEDKVCNECEYLKIQISKLQNENEKLLNQLLNRNSVPQDRTVEPEENQVLKTGFIPWRAKRQQLEMEDRQRVEQLRQNLVQNHNKDIENLEKEILGKEVDSIELNEGMGDANS